MLLRNGYRSLDVGMYLPKVPIQFIFCTFTTTFPHRNYTSSMESILIPFSEVV